MSSGRDLLDPGDLRRLGIREIQSRGDISGVDEIRVTFTLEGFLRMRDAVISSNGDYPNEIVIRGGRTFGRSELARQFSMPEEVRRKLVEGEFKYPSPGREPDREPDRKWDVNLRDEQVEMLERVKEREVSSGVSGRVVGGTLTMSEEQMKGGGGGVRSVTWTQEIDPMLMANLMARASSSQRGVDELIEEILTAWMDGSSE